MMGERQVDQGALFYKVSVERHVPADPMLRSVDRFVDLGDVRADVAPFHSSTGRPSVDPELLIRMLIVGYCYGIRSERRLCEEVHLDLADRWFCRLIRCESVDARAAAGSSGFPTVAFVYQVDLSSRCTPLGNM